MLAAFNFFVAVKAESNSDLKVARKRLQHFLKTRQTLTANTNVHVATVVEEPYGPNTAKRARINAFMQRELAPVFSAYPEVNLQFHVVPLLRPHLYGSVIDISMCKAELLCSKAAALQCQVMIIGGQSRMVRDSPPATFLIGHTTRHCILKRSAVPVYLEACEQLVLPGHSTKGSSIKGKAPVRHLPFQPRMSLRSSPVAAAA